MCHHRSPENVIKSNLEYDFWEGNGTEWKYTFEKLQNLKGVMILE